MSDLAVQQSHRYAFGLIISGFLALGLMFGAWQVMITDLQQALQLSEGAFGLALTLGVLGSLPAMFFTGRLVDHWGARHVMVGACIFTALMVGQLYWVDSYVALVAILFLILGSAGALDVAINAAAVNYEQNTQQKKMGFFHAGYSGGAAASALLTGVLLAYHVPFRWIYLGVSGVLLLVGIGLGFARHFDSVVSRAKKSPVDETTAPYTFGVLIRMPLLLILAAITALTFFSEGTLEIWSAVYLRLALDLSVLLGAAGPAIFHFAMMVGRLTSAWVLTHFDRQSVLLVAGLMAGLGMLLSLSTVLPTLILTGFLLAGLALAGIVPIVFSLAGDIAPKHAGQVISVITIVGYAGFLIGPALVGGLAEALGLRTALMLLIVASAGIIGLSFGLQRYRMVGVKVGG